MNGRIYDSEAGRFFSADPHIQFPLSTQGFNRYSYVGNNPLSYSDPSGFSVNWGAVGQLLDAIGDYLVSIGGWFTVMGCRVNWSEAISSREGTPRLGYSGLRTRRSQSRFRSEPVRRVVRRLGEEGPASMQRRPQEKAEGDPEGATPVVWSRSHMRSGTSLRRLLRNRRRQMENWRTGRVRKPSRRTTRSSGRMLALEIFLKKDSERRRSSRSTAG